MRGSWLLMFFVVQVGNLVKTLHGSLHGWNEADEPTCEELRALWNTISQSVKMSEFTNEIPLLPLEVFSYIDNHHQKSGRRKHQKNEYFRTANTLQDIFPNSRLSQSSSSSFPVSYEHSTSPNQELNGIFHNFHEPSPGLTDWDTASSFSKPSAAQSGTKKKGVGEIMHSPSWGLPEEVGMFGRFIDFDEDVPVVANSHNVKTSVGEWSEPLYPGMSLELYPKGVALFESSHGRNTRGFLISNAMNMNRYTNTELGNIHFIHNLANGNGCVTFRLNGERYPKRQQPKHQTASEPGET
ncbi:uncharacterized protein TNCV_449891 [Trichonephila clavipes]|nr:uncharacterized protein TNCV_449891 [Trichonephila clavipes]